MKKKWIDEGDKIINSLIECEELGKQYLQVRKLILK